MLSREARLAKWTEIPWDIRAIRKDSTRLQENILNSNFVRDVDKFKFCFPWLALNGLFFWLEKSDRV